MSAIWQSPNGRWQVHIAANGLLHRYGRDLYHLVDTEGNRSAGMHKDLESALRTYERKTGDTVSVKQASVEINSYVEGTDDRVTISASVDYINPGYVYLKVGDDETLAIPDAEAQALARFISRETR